MRAACLEIAPSYVPAFTLMDEAAALYPRVARGEVSGDRALLMKASLWVAYFDNRNGYYALNNRVVAAAVAARAAGAGRGTRPRGRSRARQRHRGRARRAFPPSSAIA